MSADDNLRDALMFALIEQSGPFIKYHPANDGPERFVIQWRGLADIALKVIEDWDTGEPADKV